MKICLVSDQYSKSINELEASEISGIGLHTHNMVRGLLERNYEVTLICNQKQNNPIKDFRYVYIRDWKFDMTCKRWLTFSINLSKQIVDLQKRYKFDIFHSLDAKQGALAASKLAIPTIGNVNDYYAAVTSFSPVDFFREYRGDWIKRYAYHLVTKLFEKRNYKNFDILIANSNATRKHLIENYNLPENKFKLVYKALPGFPQIKNYIVVKKDGNYNILMVGTNLQRKGIYYLIDAAPKILSEFPKVTFHIIGRTQKPMLNKCRYLKVINNFKFYGNLPHNIVETHYQNTDIAVMPSLIEGLAMALVEAMSYGIPAIGTKGTGFDDLIDNGINGYLVSPKSSCEIAEAINHLLRNVDLREKFSKEAFKKAKEFSAERQVENHIKIYNELLEK